jgi:hypothetical protein
MAAGNTSCCDSETGDTESGAPDPVFSGARLDPVKTVGELDETLSPPHTDNPAANHKMSSKWSLKVLWSSPTSRWFFIRLV